QRLARDGAYTALAAREALRAPTGLRDGPARRGTREPGRGADHGAGCRSRRADQRPFAQRGRHARGGLRAHRRVRCGPGDHAGALPGSGRWSGHRRRRCRRPSLCLCAHHVSALSARVPGDGPARSDCCTSSTAPPRALEVSGAAGEGDPPPRRGRRRRYAARPLSGRARSARLRVDRDDQDVRARRGVFDQNRFWCTTVLPSPSSEDTPMTYDLLIKNGRIIDGSGRPAFHGDVGVARGKIVELGRLDGPARRVIEADGRAVAPGFVDNHCHYDAQVLWDPLCTFSCHHGATSVIIGNCSLALAPVKAADREKLAGMLSYVEAIPMDVLQAGVPWTWQTFPEYMSTIGQRLAVNVGTFVGHSAIRLYAMGKDCSERDATDAELEEMRRVVREALEAGALGLSITRNMNHFDIAGKRIPAACAPESELFALADVL